MIGTLIPVRNLKRCNASIAWRHNPHAITRARLDCRAPGSFGDNLKSLTLAT
ncbi:hypothetical protein [Pseudomonas sp. 1152_12]|uniref:hypothetical protein n=1 Tax=Pseudomonas sp. 1152_12 TaxID=2604455 RepID=UPI00406445FA